MAEPADGALAGVGVQHCRTKRRLVQALLRLSRRICELDFGVRELEIDSGELVDGVGGHDKLVQGGFFPDQIDGVDRGISSVSTGLDTRARKAWAVSIIASRCGSSPASSMG